ncbi:MAG: RNase adapter RapZ [Chromatiales bacterium]|nr:RNase adapter RapZ [Chromatiales bacterium]
MRLLIVSGLSGSGKTVALHILEDLGFYCIDNIPALLIRPVISSLVDSGDPRYESVAVGVDARNPAGELAALPQMLLELRDRGIRCEILFLRAEDEVLLKRYAETRRRHPLSADGLSLRDAIMRERELLEPLIASAELVIDTSQTSAYQLRELVATRVAGASQGRLSILLESFGFKHGIPADADFVFDLRCLPNPYWEPTLRPLTGRDARVIDWLDADTQVQRMYRDILGFLQNWIPDYQDFNRSYLTIALGCTGGQHRSVYMTEKLAAALRERYPALETRHTALPGL